MLRKRLVCNWLIRSWLLICEEK